ncbi:MAG TPA: hypothetical protein VJ650_12175 [Gemmatimonadaceae bacterium]|nr:hypothetical protein [Gemmatimonadaceae bacterium]
MRRFTSFLVLLGALTTLAHTRAHAQEAAPVAVGARVRLTLPEPGDRRFGVFPHERWIVGEVVGVTGETLTVRPHPVLPPIDVPRSAIQRLQVSRGEPSRWRSALQDAVGGAVVGMLWGHVLYDYDLRSGAFDTQAHARSRGAIAGAAGLAFIGALFPREQWRRVR